mmetsp:Transcript_51395/g.102094  ORF Transcript_51395/g.102094 Transcript_51395/m.102094 type:complete len:100 (-) Transcript_51395:158-457(-)
MKGEHGAKIWAQESLDAALETTDREDKAEGAADADHEEFGRQKARDALESALNTSHTVTSEQTAHRTRDAPEEFLAFQSAREEDTSVHEVAEAVASAAS